MTTRYNYKWVAPEKKSEPIKIDYELVKRIKPISFNEDKSVKEYVEEEIYVEKKTKWADFIKSFNIGSISEQVMNHLTKGTPLITGHTLPAGDYTPSSLLKGAEIKREMESKGITLEMIYEALTKQVASSVKVQESEVSE